jgi:hypothetical protein
MKRWISLSVSLSIFIVSIFAIYHNFTPTKEYYMKYFPKEHPSAPQSPPTVTAHPGPTATLSPSSPDTSNTSPQYTPPVTSVSPNKTKFTEQWNDLAIFRKTLEDRLNEKSISKQIYNQRKLELIKKEDTLLRNSSMDDITKTQRNIHTTLDESVKQSKPIPTPQTDPPNLTTNPFNTPIFRIPFFGVLVAGLGIFFTVLFSWRSDSRSNKKSKRKIAQLEQQLASQYSLLNIIPKSTDFSVS